MGILENPELLRYVRSELRPARAMAIIGGLLTGTILLGLIAYSTSLRPNHTLDHQNFWETLHGTMFVISASVLLLWSVIACAHSVVGERAHRTFDFWRITRLEPTTLTVGKVFGPTLGAWLQYAAVLPVIVVAGSLAHLRVTVILSSYLLIALTAVAYSFLAVCFSTRATDPRRAQAVVLLLFLPFLARSFNVDRFAARDTSSAWEHLVPFASIIQWLGGKMIYTPIFGHPIAAPLVSCAIALVAIAFCYAALRHSIKYDAEQRSLFTPTQAVGLMAFLQLFAYAAFTPPPQVWHAAVFGGKPGWDLRPPEGWESLQHLLLSSVSLNIFTLFLVIVLTVMSRERLRTLVRNSTPVNALMRILGPWMAVAAIGEVALIAAVLGHANAWGHPHVPWSSMICVSAAIFIYAIGDGLFLQWMAATRTKAPVVKGVLILCCSYGLAGSIAAAAQAFGKQAPAHVARWLSPMVVGNGLGPSLEVLFALIPPAAVGVLLARSLLKRMSRPAKALHFTAAA